MFVRREPSMYGTSIVHKPAWNLVVIQFKLVNLLKLNVFFNTLKLISVLLKKSVVLWVPQKAVLMI